MKSLFSRLRASELVAILVIGGVIVALLLPSSQWASDGDIRLPVKILVFDAVHCVPISDARCLIFRAPPVSDQASLRQHPASDFPINEAPENSRGTTDIAGVSVIEHSFGTSASHKKPSPRAHLMNYWIRVEAIGFGGVVVPVGYDERLTSEMRREGRILISIGLMPTD